MTLVAPQWCGPEIRVEGEGELRPGWAAEVAQARASMPDLLIVVLVPPLLIVSTLLLAQVERRVTASRRLPAPPSPSAGLACAAEAQEQLDGNEVSGAHGGAHAQTGPDRGHRRAAARMP